jgi:hypothetical protein
MMENIKIKGLTKLFNTLVIPTVNNLTDETGFKIHSIVVEGSHILEDEKWYEISVEVSRDELDSVYDGVAHLMLNAFEYMADAYVLEIKFYNFETKYYYNFRRFDLDGDRISNNEAIELIEKADDDGQ